MKTKIVALGIILCLFSTNIYGQGQWFPPNTIDTPKPLYDKNSKYWKKYKVLNRIGWTGLGVGVFAIAAIPVFICAGQKKEKAIVVSAGCGNLATPLSGGKLACRQGIALQICF